MPLSVTAYGDLTPDNLAATEAFADAERAARILRDLSGNGVPDSLFERLLPPLLEALVACADPDRALGNFERWSARLGARGTQFAYLADHPPAIGALVAVFAGSQFFSNVLIRNPEYAEVVTNERLRARPKTFAAFFRDASRAVDVFSGGGGKRTALRRFKALEMLRIGARDLVGAADAAEIAREISDFADTVVQKAVEFCAREEMEKHGLTTPPPFAVIGMGKLGGRELNYSSDIDLIFVHGDADVPPGYAAALAERLVAALSQPLGGEGFVFRVDMRLRPEGRFGPLSRSIQSCRAYYESWAETWERQALLKARPIAGDPAVGEAFVRLVQPFVSGRSGAREDVAETLRENKRRIEARMVGAGTWRSSVKEGYGGIRDIEFAVQMHQILNGRAHPALRLARGTSPALRQLARLGVLTEDERAFLDESYWFLRAVEHRLQILNELPVRDLPGDPAERRRLARRMGFPDAPAFDAHYVLVTERVRALSLRLMGFVEEAAEESEDWATLIAAAHDDSASAARLRHRLGERGFTDTARAAQLLAIPAVGTQQGASTPETRRLFARLAPALIALCGATADPEAALFGMESLAEASGGREALYATLAEPGGETLLARLCQLGAGAPPLMTNLARYPALLDMLFDDDEMRIPATRDDLSRRIHERLATSKDAVAALGAFWRRERLRIAARDLWGETPDVETTGAELTDLAEAMLDGLLLVAAGRADAADTLPRLAVIGLGRFGGRELSFASDGDLLYVHDRDEDAAAAIRIADALRVLMNELRSKQGVDMEFDPRLRPDGRFGLLSRTPEAYDAYYERDAALWEKQTLLKARFVSGNPDVARRFLEIAGNALANSRPNPERVAEMRAMKRRIETERVKPSEIRTDLKLGHGALSDIEWTAQLLQWQNAVPLPGTRAALRVLTTIRVLPRDEFLTLIEAYDFLSRLRDCAYLRANRADDGILSTGGGSGDDARLRPVALLMGFESAAALREEHAARTDAVRAVFRRRFEGEN